MFTVELLMHHGRGSYNAQRGKERRLDNLSNINYLLGGGKNFRVMGIDLSASPVQ
jgi:hypothetical protein